MTLTGACSAAAGAGWTLVAAFDPAGLAIAVAGIAALAYDQLVRSPREERAMLERRRQLDLVVHSACKLLEIRRASQHEDTQNAPPPEQR